ncbi:bax inhibitor 1-like [Solanum dulcamara]|uniref:bax inhibitor 1-like n=1 Tax=Solanum dulcamara TaxID=45834 RepID=UPI0024866268|nr:bax inhibitor 1-like [Solanum dulcamara]
MKFSNMKNAVKAYFERNWNREDMVNPDEIPMHAHESLKKVYLTLFCAMLTATFGSFLHLIWEAGGLFTVLSSVASLLCLYLTSPWSVKTRVLMLMISTFSFGASVGIFTKYFFEIDQDFVVSLLAGAAIGFGTFWFGALLSRIRIILYIGCLLHSYVFMFSWFVIASDMIFIGHAAQWTLKVFAVLSLFMGYFVIYSQEILFNALSEDVNFVNCTFTVFFNLPAIVVHVARLELIEVTEHYRQS